MSDEPLLVLEIPIAPQAVQSVRFKRCGDFMRTYQPEKVTNWKGFVKASAYYQLPEGWEILDCPIRADIIYSFPPRKTDLSKKKIKAWLEEGVIMKETRPDLGDNLGKGLFDVLTGVVWKDDSKVVWGEFIKVFSERPFIGVVINKIEPHLKIEELPSWVKDNFFKTEKSNNET